MRLAGPGGVLVQASQSVVGERLRVACSRRSGRFDSGPLSRPGPRLLLETRGGRRGLSIEPGRSRRRGRGRGRRRRFLAGHDDRRPPRPLRIEKHPVRDDEHRDRTDGRQRRERPARPQPIPERHLVRYGHPACRRLRLRGQVRRRRLHDGGARPRRRRLIQTATRQGARLLETFELAAAAGAAGDVRVHAGARVRRQLPIEELHHLRADVFAVGRHHRYPDPEDSAALGGSPPSSTRAARNFSSAYRIRLFTVGSDAPTAAAISANGISITSRIRNTSR